MDDTRHDIRPARLAGPAILLLCLVGFLTLGPVADGLAKTLQLDVADGLVTARLAAAPLKDVARLLEEKTGLSVVLDDRVATAEVTASFDKLSLKQAVETILEPFSTVVTYDRNRTMRGVFVMEGGASGPPAGPAPGIQGSPPMPVPAQAPFVPPPAPPVSPAIPEPQPAPAPEPQAQEPQPMQPAQEPQAPQAGQEPQTPPPAALGGPVPEGQAGPTLPLPPAVPSQEPGQTQ
jgi:hypothetical protein